VNPVVTAYDTVGLVRTAGSQSAQSAISRRPKTSALSRTGIVAAYSARFPMGLNPICTPVVLRDAALR